MWYYAIDDDQHGPIPAAELKALAQQGTISSLTLVWKDGMDDWLPASQVPGLLSQKTPPRRSASTDPYDYHGDDRGYGYSGSRYAPEGASTVLILGILSLVMCGAFAGVAAWITGNNYMERCRSAGVEPEGIAVAGRICGMISCGLTIIPLIMFAGFFVLALLTGG